MTRLAGAAILIGGASALAAQPALENPAVPVPPSVARRAEAPLRAGFAKRVITPALDRPVYLAGFGHDRRATGLHDDLFARCLAVSDGRLELALCAVDLIGLFLTDVDKARALLAARRPGARLVVASTHNHEGPDTMGLWGPSAVRSGVDAVYLEGVRRDIAETAAEALAGMKPARFTFATGTSPGLIADGREPRVVDEAIVIARVTGMDGASLGSLVSWSSHPEALGGKNTLLTADYPHFLVRKVEDALGGTTVFVAGAIGGLMTPLSVELKDVAGRPVPLESFAHAEAIGTRAAEAALLALSGTGEERAAPPGAMPAKAGARGESAPSALEYRSRRVFVPLANTLFRLGFAVGIFERPLFTHGLPDKGTGLALYEGVPLPLPRGEDLETEIGYVRIGDAEVLLVPGEIYPELVRGGIQEPQDIGADFLGAPKEAPLLGLLTARHRMVIGLANDAIGYIVPRSQWDEKPPFAYGRAESQYGEVNSVGDRVAPVLASAFARLLGRPDPR